MYEFEVVDLISCPRCRALCVANRFPHGEFLLWVPSFLQQRELRTQLGNAIWFEWVDFGTRWALGYSRWHVCPSVKEREEACRGIDRSAS